jgi:shikimate kinase
MKPLKAVFLCGLMGSGKSTVGRKLALRLKWRFVDTDSLVVSREGQSIPFLFKKYGEPGFRRRESAALKSLKPGRGLVVATGGGLPTLASNRAWMRRHGLLVHLAISPRRAYARLGRKGREARPLLQGGLKALLSLAAKRAKAYAQADLQLRATRPPAALAMEIARKIQPLLAPGRKSPR